MRWHKHTELEGKHAFLTPSSPAWLRYDDDKLARRYMEHLAHLRGTEEHAFAAQAIKLKHRLPEEDLTVNMYVNDCIDWRMRPEVPLFWEYTCFGTADAIGLDERHMLLRVSDLKTGKTPTTFDQLLVYAALFCLEYEFDKPHQLGMEFELRIYQSNKIKLEIPSPHEVFQSMDKILTSTRIIQEIREEMMG